MDNKATELEWLQWFYCNADFGPADGDVQRATNPIFGAHIATFSPDVAAALVAVADAAADHIDCPLCGLAGGEHEVCDECPLATLAAALGVSR